MRASDPHPLRRLEPDPRVALAFDLLPLSVAVLDRDGVIIAVNRHWEQFAQANGADPLRTGAGESYLRVCAAAAPDEAAVSAAEGLRDVLEGRATSFRLEYPCHSPTERRWFLMWAAPLPETDAGGVGGARSDGGIGGGGGGGGAVVAHLDITRRREAELALADRVAALERSNEDLAAFGRIVAHDVKEPLRGMGAYAGHVLEDAPDLATALRGKLETIVRLSSRTRDALDGLLHYAQVGMSELALTPVDLGALAREVLDSFRPQLEAAGARASAAAGLGTIRCDRHLAAQAMANLVSNAIKYNDKPEKRVEIGPAEGGFFVRDNGIGIDPRSQSRVFEVFRRLHARGEFGGGAGLGLSLVKRIAERHGGSVTVESSPGEGSTFTVRLATGA